MADGINVPLTGTGDATAKLLTDDTGAGGHAQVIKLAQSGDGVASLVGADASNGLDVDVTRVQGSVTTAPDTVASATTTQKASSATSITLAASNASRKGLYIFNDSLYVLYVKLGATASTTSYLCQIGPGGFWEMPNRPVYTGVVDGIWATAGGNAYVTEV
jgi:hypothetical protein